jgi:predicted GIY-YIG superfamily endonuclease
VKGFVYLLECCGTTRFKIGYTSDLQRRLKELNGSQSAHMIKLLEFIETDRPQLVEKELHAFYRSKRVRGEWFDFGVLDLPRVKLHFHELQKRENPASELKTKKVCIEELSTILRNLFISQGISKHEAYAAFVASVESSKLSAEYTKTNEFLDRVEKQGETLWGKPQVNLKLNNVPREEEVSPDRFSLLANKLTKPEQSELKSFVEWLGRQKGKEITYEQVRGNWAKRNASNRQKSHLDSLIAIAKAQKLLTVLSNSNYQISEGEISW